MNKERYELCKRFIEEGRWRINLDEGIVTGKLGGQGNPNNRGYLVVGVSDNNKNYHFRVHEIIAIAGGLNPINLDIDHINGNQLDNRLTNLQLLSHEDNVRKALEGKGKTKATNAKLTNEQVAEIKMMLLDGKLSQECIAWLYNVHPTTICNIKKNKIFKYVEVLDYV